MAESWGSTRRGPRRSVFLVAALLASASGWLYAHLQRFVNPTPFSLTQGIEYLFMAVVGGVGHVWGAVLGAGLVTVLEARLQDLLPRLLGQSGNFETIVFGVAMVALLQQARDGLWPLPAPAGGRSAPAGATWPRPRACPGARPAPPAPCCSRPAG